MKCALQDAGVPSSTRHLFVCIGPDCCRSEEGLVLWNRIKGDIKAHGLKTVLRTKAGCFRICQGGPWIVIYPEGVWYGGVTLEVWDRILREHLMREGAIPDLVALVHPLEPSSAD
jgi:(2Fe-2S) ferredoxin